MAGPTVQVEKRKEELGIGNPVKLLFEDGALNRIPDRGTPAL